MLKNRLRRLALIATLLGASFMLLANTLVNRAGVYTTAALHQLPASHACLVLGTSPRVGDKLNRFYQYRMAAAAEVFKAGKCKVLVVSGDNRRTDYNEPEDMKASLIALGVPASAIHCDYAGGRTLDSVLRFQQVFGQQAGIVISQAFHNQHAIYIARAHGIALSGYNAKDVDTYNAFKTRLRELFSKSLAVLDVWLGREARHYGEKVAI